MRRWNRDKPHRCPGCHAVAYRGDAPLWARWWLVQECGTCGVKFAGWGWG